jgi:hypothetical protein
VPIAGRASERHNRDAVHERRSQPGEQIGRARTAGGDADADFAGRARIAIGGMRGVLLVTNQHMVQSRVARQLAIERQRGTARVAKQHGRANGEQRLARQCATGQAARRRAVLDSRGRNVACDQSDQDPSPFIQGRTQARVRGTTLLLRDRGALVGMWLGSDLRLALPHPPCTVPRALWSVSSRRHCLRQRRHLIYRFEQGFSIVLN